jgi:serine/threonine-protein kinase RsbW
MKSITVPSRLECLDEVIAFIETELNEAGCAAKILAQIDIAVEEIFVNIAHYAYEGDGLATVACGIQGGKITVTFTDGGVPYNPLEKEDPDTSSGAGDRKIGGLGIFIVKKSMDNMTYRYEDGKNILTIEKVLA